MSIVLLRSFVEVYRQGSVSKAAIELGLTQPAVSGHIAALETTLERKLFTRHARGVKPTVIADELAARVSGAIDTAEGVLAEVRARSGALEGTIHICGNSDILSDLVTARLGRLVASGISVQMHPSPAGSTIPMLLEGRSDFGLAGREPRDARIDYALYGREELVLVADPATAAQLRHNDHLGKALTRLPFLSYGLDRYLIHAWLEYNQVDTGDADEVVGAPDSRALRNYVVAGLGWSVLPRYFVAYELATGRLHEVQGTRGNPVQDYFLLWPKSALRNPRTARARAILLDTDTIG